MRPRIISLTCLLMAATVMVAQSIKQHEYWIDTDYSSRQTTNSGSTVSMTVSTAGLSPGVHFFNHRAQNSDDTWGVLSRMLFYVPDLPAGAVSVNSCEYWIDNDYANAVKKETADASQSFTIDISKLSAGIHYFNFRTIDTNGGYGKLLRSAFFIPLNEPDPYIVECQYWIDDAEPTVQAVEKAQSVFELALDVSGLAEGEHTFSFQAKNINGNWGEIFTEKFLIGNVVDDDIIAFACPVAESICVENWDTSGDGKLSKTEAAAVTSLGEVFKDSEIASFNELQYFTGLTKIDDSAFENCTKLDSLKLPATVTEIGTRAFVKCPFTEISFPSVLTRIKSEAFLRCQSLKSIQIPSSVEFIASAAFTSCTSVESIVVEENNASYDSREECNAIIRKEDKTLIRGCKNSIIPSGVEIIGFAAFQWTPLEGAFVVPEGVTSIGQSAFVSTTMSSISLPSTLTSLGGLAFQNCDNLESIDIPDGVTSIGDYAFSFCNNLKTVSIPKSVTKIGEKAFIGDTKLESVISYILQPSDISKNVFISEDMDDGVEEFVDATLYVPYGSKVKYEQAEGWNEFTNIVEMGETVEITIGKNGKTTYCGDKSLDFSFSDEVKAFIATGFDKNENTIWMTRVKDVPAGVPVMIKGTPEKTYEVPVTDSKNSYYKNMFVGNPTSEKIQINETSDDGKFVNYYMSGGQFKSVNGYTNISPGKCYLQLPANFEDETTGEALTIKIAASGKSSFAAPYDLDFTDFGENLKAFTATGFDKSTSTIWLTRVKKVQKGEGLMLKGNGGETYTIPSTGVQAIYENMIVGNISGETLTIYETSDDGTLTNFYLKNGTYMSVSGNASIGNNKSYLELPTSMLAGARSENATDAADAQTTYGFVELETESMPIIFASIGGDDDTTGIVSMDNGQWIMDNASDEWYTISGQRISKPTKKGLYIHNGKKVVIR